MNTTHIMRHILVFLFCFSTGMVKSQSNEIKYFTLEDSAFTVGSIYQIDSMYFDYNGSGLLEESKARLLKVIKFLAKNRNLKVALILHTDARGNDAYNLRISEYRAEMMVDYFVHKGIPIDRLVPVGKGESEPYTIREQDNFLTPGTILHQDYIESLTSKDDKADAYRLNRRAEMKILSTSYIDTFTTFIDTFYDPSYWSTLLFQDQQWILEKSTVIDGIFFEFDDDQIQAKSYLPLDKFATYLKWNDSLLIEVSFHSDCRGNEAIMSRNLTQARADAIKHYLTERGIHPQRIISKGYGSKKPRIYKGDTLNCSFIQRSASLSSQEYFHQLNRRLEFRILRTDFYPIKNTNTSKAPLFVLPHPKRDFGVDFSSELDSTIRTIYAYLKDHPEKRIELKVHTDCRGTEEANLELTKNIGAQILIELERLGISNNRIRITAMGENEAIEIDGVVYSCSYINQLSTLEEREYHHALNRRIEIFLLPIEYDY